MKPVTADEMRRLDRTAIEQFHIPSLVLMENAGRGVSEIIARDTKPCRVVIFVGKGNNGGDGLVVARHLHTRGFSVRVAMVEDPAKLKTDPLVNFHLVEKLEIPTQPFSDETSMILEADLIVDALFGIGLNSDLRGVFASCVAAINAANRPVISIDIPSGLDADSGKVYGVAVKAALTVTLALPKLGLLSGDGPEHAGKIETIDIGIPHDLITPYLE